ncbi:MAG: AlpA family phage regulatory protein [Hyphomicrobiaceae bacterium]
MIASLTGSRRWRYELIEVGRFPQAVLFGSRRVGWRARFARE